MKRTKYSDRAKVCQNPTGRRLLELMDAKKSNLAVAADVVSSEELIVLAEAIGPEIVCLKTHIDIVTDFSKDLVSKLEALAKKHDFLIFEDRKFADIGNTVKQQYGGGIYQIASWAHLTNAHALPGPGIVQGLQEVGLPLARGLLLLAQLSSKGNLIDDAYAHASVEMARQFPEFVCGFIAQRKLCDDPGLVTLTPGVNLVDEGDALGQQYNTPDLVIGERDSDCIIVGRGIIKADNPREAAGTYRQAGWEAYLKALGSEVN